MGFNWTRVDDGLIVSSYPVGDEEYQQLRAEGVTILINLHDRDHGAKRLARVSLTELHLPVRDFTPPTVNQIDAALAAIDRTIADGGVADVHCAAGLGRAGTVVACWLVRGGLTADAAVDRIRDLRPGSVETREQIAAVHEFAARLQARSQV